MQTVTDARIYAVGECAAHRGIAYGLVAPLFEQAKVCGQPPGAVRHRPLPRLADLDQAQGHRHRPVLRRRLHGRRRHRGDRAERSRRRRLQEAGDQGRQAGRRLPVRRHGRRQLVLQAAARRPQRRRHPRQADVRRIATSATPATRARARRAAMPDDAEVCGCNGVCKGTICKAIKDKGLFTLDEVRKHTKASASLRLVHRPGRADPDVHRRRRLLGHAEEEGRCAAAPTHSHQEVRDAIREQQLLTIADAYAAAWTGARPTAAPPAGRRINYYLISHLAEGGEGRSADRASSTSAATPTSRRTAPTR